MSKIEVNGVELHYEEAGEGSPLVLVHGSWDGGDCWDALRPLLAAGHRVVSYDRRGHRRSERPQEAWTRRDNEDDLEALIEALGLGPVYVVGNSYGGLVSLGFAARRPELIRGISVHEPPALSLGVDSALASEVAETTEILQLVVAEIEAGEAEVATRRFMEEVALGPGSWEQMPKPMRGALVANAAAFATEMTDLDWANLDLAALERVEGPILVTRGDCSPSWLQRLADHLVESIPSAETATIAGAGHAPQETHPSGYAESLRDFAGARAQVSI